MGEFILHSQRHVNAHLVLVGMDMDVLNFNSAQTGNNMMFSLTVVNVQLGQPGMEHIALNQINAEVVNS